MAITVITGWNADGYHEYGKRFLETFDRYWPSDVRLVTYIEDPDFKPLRAEKRSLYLCGGVVDFINRHKDDPVKRGAKQTDKWMERSHGKPYNFRFDAVKFSKQMFIPAHAASTLPDDDIMVWLDGDVITHNDVPHGFVEGLMAGSDLIYLGRGRTHSEIGFWAISVGKHTRALVEDMAELYRSDLIFSLNEWHSAYAFDYCRRVFEKHGGTSRNLTPDGSGHVFATSPLSPYMDHLKGRRKGLDRSPEAG